MSKPAYRPSMLSEWTMCQISAYRHYILGEKTPKSAAACIGTATHASIEANLHNKLVTGQPLPLEAALQAAADSADIAMQECDDDVSEIKDIAIGAAKEHYLSAAPLIVPVALEKRLEWDGGLDFTLTGTCDILEADCIRDTKTCGQAPGEDDVNRGGYADQLTTYHLMVGDMNLDVALDYIVKPKVLKTKTNPARYLPYKGNRRGVGDHDRLLDRFDRMHRALEAGVIQPADANSWKCSTKWCGFWHSCPHGGAPAKRPIARSNLLKTLPEAVPAPAPSDDDSGWGVSE